MFSTKNMKNDVVRAFYQEQIPNCWTPCQLLQYRDILFLERRLAIVNKATGWGEDIRFRVPCPSCSKRARVTGLQYTCMCWQWRARLSQCSYTDENWSSRHFLLEEAFNISCYFPTVFVMPGHRNAPQNPVNCIEGVPTDYIMKVLSALLVFILPAAL